MDVSGVPGTGVRQKVRAQRERLFVALDGEQVAFRGEGTGQELGDLRLVRDLRSGRLEGAVNLT